MVCVINKYIETKNNKAMKKLQAKLPFLYVLILTLFLGGCTTATPNWQNNSTKQTGAQSSPSDISTTEVTSEPLEATQNVNVNTQNVRVALLLPLTGQHARLGESMLNASQMALFDLGHDQFEIVPKDTKGTVQGAQQAAQQAVNEGAQLVIGPIFSRSVQAAQRITMSNNIPMIAFTTDWTLANQQTFLIGFLPFDQVERVTRYATNRGYVNHGVLAPTGSYGDGVISAYQAIAGSSGVKTVRLERFSDESQNLAAIVEVFSDYGARKQYETQKAQGFALGGPEKAPFDAVLIPAGGALARQVGSFLNHYDLPPSDVKRLGTGLMDDASLATDRTLDGTWFAAPAPQARARFEQRFQALYGNKPPRITSLSYDATALAAILSRTGIKKTGQPALNYNALTNPNGFSGIDGIFRFRSNGISERGLSILEFRNGQIIEIDPAPKTFEQKNF